MAGSPERPEKGIPERIRDVMVRFVVDEKTARQLLAFSALIASETFGKWLSNQKRIQRQKVLEISLLIEKARNGDPNALKEAGSKLQALLRTESWER